jgi:hypothetical protein
MNHTPSPGTQALEARQLTDELAKNVAFVAPQGITDFTRVDAAAVEFALALVNWETNPTGLRWVHVLGGYGAVVAAYRQAAYEHAMERDGEGWRLG